MCKLTLAQATRCGRPWPVNQSRDLFAKNPSSLPPGEGALWHIPSNKRRMIYRLPEPSCLSKTQPLRWVFRIGCPFSLGSGRTKQKDSPMIAFPKAEESSSRQSMWVASIYRKFTRVDTIVFHSRRADNHSWHDDHC